MRATFQSLEEAMMLTLIILPILSILSLLPIIVILVTVLIFSLYRILVEFYLRITKKSEKLKFLSRSDAIFASVDSQTRNTNNYKFECAGSFYAILKGQYDIDAIRKRFQVKILDPKQSDGTYKFIEHHQFLCNKYGYHFWVTAPFVDVNEHVVAYKGEAPKNYDELMQVFEKLLADPLPRDRPLWIITLIQLSDIFEDLKGPHYVYFEKAHHAMGNGMKYMKMWTEYLIDKPYEEDFKMFKITPKSFSDSVINILRICLLAPGYFFKGLIFQDNNALSTYKRSGTTIMATMTNPIPLKRVKGIQKLSKIKVTQNDILLSCFTYALRCYFIREGLSVPSKIRQILAMAVDFDSITHAFVFLPTDVTKPLQRLTIIKNEIDLIKDTNVGAFNFYLFHLFPNILPERLVDKIIMGSHHTVDVSNVFGIQKDATFFGSDFIDVGCFNPVTPSCGLMLTIMSWNGKYRICVTADSAVVKNKKSLKQMVEDISIELENLEKELSIS